MRVRLAPGVDPERAIAQIRELAASVSVAGRPSYLVRQEEDGPPSVRAVERRNAYVQWAMSTQGHLESVLRREDAAAFFDTPRHRDICSAFVGDHLTPMVNSELDAKRRDLEETVSCLENHRARMRAASGLPVVLDTNVLLQCQRLDQVKWSSVVNEAVRVMIPMRVLEEIEDKKYSDSKRLRRRARGLLPWIDAKFADSSPGPVTLTDGATIELVLTERPRSRPQSADDEILEVAHDVLQFAGRVRLLTEDTGMRARARAERLEVLRPPKEWLLPPDDEE